MGLIDRIKSALAGKKNIDITLADGLIATVITDAAEPQVGDSVTVDGSPAPDADHVAADGTVITTESGVITAINAPIEEPVAEPVEEEASLSITPEEQTAIVSEVMQILEPRLLAIEERLAALEGVGSEEMASVKSLAKSQKEIEKALMLIAERTSSTGVVPVAIQKSVTDPVIPKKITSKLVSKSKKLLKWQA